ncbi:hypothetical protein [Streptomyces chartreusis]
MATLAEIRAALKDTIKATNSEMNIYPMVADVQQVPAVVIMPAPAQVTGMSCNFNGAFGRGMDEWTLDLIVMVSRVDATLAQKTLDQYVTGKGPKSLRQILFQNPTVGLTDGTDVQAEGIREYDALMPMNAAGIQYVGAALRVTVRTPSN